MADVRNLDKKTISNDAARDIKQICEYACKYKFSRALRLHHPLKSAQLQWFNAI